LQNGRDREIGVKFEEETLDFEFSFLTRNKKRKSAFESKTYHLSYN